MELPQGSVQLALKDEAGSVTGTYTLTLFYKIFFIFFDALVSKFGRADPKILITCTILRVGGPNLISHCLGQARTA